MRTRKDRRPAGGRGWALAAVAAGASWLAAGPPLEAQGGCVNTRLISTPMHLEEILRLELDIEQEEGAELREQGSELEQREVPRRADQPKLLGEGAWELSTTLRAFKAEDVFIGTEEIHAAKEAGVNPIGEFTSLDLNLIRYLSKRWSLTLALPLVSARGSFRQGDGERHDVDAGLQIGDLRLTATRWLFDPERRRSGNVALSFGLKLPTGDREVRDTWHTAEGTIDPPVDMALQPGDGGTGVMLHAQGFQILARKSYFYGEGFYLVNPKESNGVATLASQGLELSVPDQYMARLGVGSYLWPAYGVSLSLGGRIDGIPKHDLLGGSEGFRRPGYTISVEPGVNVAFGTNVVSVAVPIAVQRSRQQSVPEQRAGVHAGGAMAGEAFFISYSRRF